MNEENVNQNIDNKPVEDTSKKKATKNTIILIGICVVLAIVVCVFALKGKDSLTNNSEVNVNTTNTTPINLKASYRLNGNGLNDFDIAFMQIENNGKNKVYSPLSIKYALYMLDEAADGDTKAQLDAVLGDYKVYTYPNSANMSFANAMFIKNDYKDQVLNSYVDTLKSKYNAEVKYDSFTTPDTLNSWISDKTLKLIDKMFDDTISEYDYILVNALAIDMEWVNKIQSLNKDYSFVLEHEIVKNADNPNGRKGFYVAPLDITGYGQIAFDGVDYRAASVELAAVANKYDIISELGIDNIKSTVLAEHEKWLQTASEDEKKNDSFNIDNYIDDIISNYGNISGSTDFLFYDDENIKVFAKDLKTYNNKTLQYVGIMPKSVSLIDYVKNVDAAEINNVVSSLKAIELNSFDDGYLTYIYGSIPLFEYEYDLRLLEDLNMMGIHDAFDSVKANLSKMTSNKSYISSAKHKANIKFSNDGIKAAAATTMGGRGAIGFGFEYDFDIPLKEIDLTFDKPFMYIIRDKDTGEVWFAGTVYKPLEYSSDLQKEW